MDNIEKVYSRGEVIIREGEQDKAIYLLKSGKLGVLKGDRLVAEIGNPGVFFGEMSVLLDQPRSVTVKALTPCVVEMYEADIDTLIGNHPQTSRLILRTLAERLVETTTRLYRCMLAWDEYRTSISTPSTTSFEDLAATDNRIIERALELVNDTDLVAALLGTTPRVRNKFFSNMSRRKAEVIKQDMHVAISFLTRRAVESAKLRILKKIAALASSELDSIEIKRIGEILVEMQLITASQLSRTLEKQKEGDIFRHRRLGEIMIEGGLITVEELDKALEAQQMKLGPRTQ